MSVGIDGARLVIGTRGSALARWQADHISAELTRLHPGLDVELRIIVTDGDRFQSGPVIELGGKGVWVKEIEEALLAGTIDLAVHSLKDVPTDLAPGLVLAAIPLRADPRDVLVSRSGQTLANLPAGSRVGTSSLRRVCQVLALRPDVTVELLRGNVDTRLRKVAEGVVDAAVLAAAGLDRLGLSARITERLSPDDMLPAIGQGALAIEARVDDARVLGFCRTLSDPDSELTIAAERALLAGLGAGCRTPVGGYAVVHADTVVLRGLVGRPDASLILRDEVRGPRHDAAALGATLARRLLAQGADAILAELG
ncbi:MAG: hydroxymethylbilane synthase [Deltaproteobacteria bacterium]|nr:hydroxymethylbilane synthase [Deltaproteobacteria bacterium]